VGMTRRMTTLRPGHLGRYATIGALLVKHRHHAHLAAEGGVVAAAGDASSHEDALRLVEDLEAMGPTFVKLGQVLSTRADLLPPAYLDALSRLQDSVEPFGFDQVETIVERELGVRLSKAFRSFDHTPMASASLGQVHRAVLRDGRQVAVKVQRPGIRARVLEDMDVIEELAGFVDAHTRVGDQLRFAAMVSEFRWSLVAELDYLQEADNLRTLARHLAPYPRLVVPQPVADYTTARILTMDLVEGRNVSSLGPLAQMELDGQALALELFRAYLDQILVHGFVHADPHPGNVLLTATGDLAMIDLGMVVHVAPGLQDRLIRLLASVSEGRAEEAADVLIELGERREDFDAGAYRRHVARLVSTHRSTTVEGLEVGRVMGELARAAGTCGLTPPVEMTMVGKALLNLDEVARILDPEFDPNSAIRDHIAGIARDRLLASATPANLLHAAMDAKEFAERLPGRVNKVMDALAAGELTLKVQGIDDAELMRGIQKLANRITGGLVVAALIVGAAMLMRVETDARLFGYPALAMVLFLLATAVGLWLVVTSARHDLPPHRRKR